MTRAVDSGNHAQLANVPASFEPFRLSRSFWRSLGVIAIGLANFVIVYGSVSSLLRPANGANWRDYYRWELQLAVVTAIQLGPLLVLACWAALARDRWFLRASIAIGGFLFWLLAAGWGIWGGAPGIENTIGAFWLGLVVLIPCRAGLGISIGPIEESGAPRPRAQFRIADILEWTAAIAVTLAYLRLFGPGYSSRTPARIIYESALSLTATALVLVPVVRIMMSKERRFRRLFALFGAIVLVCASFAIAYFAVNYFARWYWWGEVFWQPFRLFLFLVALTLSLMANFWALERLGLRWRCTNSTAGSEPTQ